MLILAITGEFIGRRPAGFATKGTSIPLVLTSSILSEVIIIQDYERINCIWLRKIQAIYIERAFPGAQSPNTSPHPNGRTKNVRQLTRHCRVSKQTLTEGFDIGSQANNVQPESRTTLLCVLQPFPKKRSCTPEISSNQSSPFTNLDQAAQM